MTDQLSQPKLWWTWELGFPHLYKAVIEVWANGVLVDKRFKYLGLKKSKWTKIGSFISMEREFLSEATITCPTSSFP